MALVIRLRPSAVTCTARLSVSRGDELSALTPPDSSGSRASRPRYFITSPPARQPAHCACARGGIALLSESMASTLVMLPPQTPTTRQWASRLRAAATGLSIEIPEGLEEAARIIGQAEAAFGTIPGALLRQATRLRWLQAPQAAPPAGYYYAELIAHPVAVTNFREIYNDHIGAHIMAFVLAFARGLHRYFPQQQKGEWRPAPLDTGVVHLPEATTLIVGVGGIGAEAARLAAAFGMRVIGVDARRREAPPGVAEMHGADALDALLGRVDFVILTVPHTPATVGFMDRARFRRMKP